MIAKIEPDIDAMVKDQGHNAVVQFRAAQLYSMLGPVGIHGQQRQAGEREHRPDY